MGEVLTLSSVSMNRMRLQTTNSSNSATLPSPCQISFLSRRNRAPASDSKIAQPHRSDRHTYQPQRWMANSRRHAPNLTVLSLIKHNLEPGCWYGMADPNRNRALRQGRLLCEETDDGGLGAFSAQDDAAAQLGKRRFIWYPLDVRPIHFGQFVVRIGDAMG